MKSGTVSMRMRMGAVVRTGGRVVLETRCHQDRVAGGGRSGLHVADGAAEVVHTGYCPKAPGHAHMWFQRVKAFLHLVGARWDIRDTAVSAQPVPTLEAVLNHCHAKRAGGTGFAAFSVVYCSCWLYPQSINDAATRAG